MNEDRPARRPGAAAPRSFATASAFRSWLEGHHATSRELLVRCYKNHARGSGMTYFEALDEALCYGWIDGVRRSLDGDSFSVRFSPRKARSRWSLVNTRRARALRAAGRLHASGLAAFEARDPRDLRLYSFEARRRELRPDLKRRLRANPDAWDFFRAQPPWYRRTAAFWVMAAKREETRARRLGVLLDCSLRGTTIPALTRPQRRK